MKKYFLNAERRFDLIYTFVLLILLLIIYFPCLSTPPRSDYWQMFYFFHHFDELPGKIKLIHILNYDVFEQIRYQPISRLPYYFLHLLVGSNFIFFNILNFLLYFLSALILFKFALNFSKDRTITALFIGLFVFLFSHFDILIWSYHIYIIAGFCMCMIGFMGYIRFLKTGRMFFLYSAVLFLILGILCYESFFLWPFAIIILSSIGYLKTEKGSDKAKIIKTNCLVLGAIYIFCILLYLFTRAIGTYDRPLRELSDFMKVADFIRSSFLILFNTLYNGILVNFYPLLSFPLSVAENIELGGPILKFIETRHSIVFIGGVFAGIVLFFCLFWLNKKRYLDELKTISFFLFLFFSAGYVLFFCRLITNEFDYSLRQFRYQYIFNAIFIVIVIFVISRFLEIKNRKKLYIMAVFIFALNIYCIKKVIDIYNYQFRDLKMMLSNIRVGMRSGLINNKDKLYIDKDITDYFPILCWNIEMGERFVEGNYQWMFSEKEAACFSDSLRDATWIIDKKDFGIVRKSPEALSKKGIKINSLKDKTYVEIEKDRKYIELSSFYKSKGKIKEAEAMLKKAIELNPRNYGVHVELARIYRAEQRYPEAEAMFKKAIELNPSSDVAYIDLGQHYRAEQRYPEAEAMFKKAMELAPRNYAIYIDLAHNYRAEGRYKEAEEMFRKALELNPKNSDTYVDLGHNYRAEGRYKEAEEMFRKALELNPKNDSLRQYLNTGQ